MVDFQNNKIPHTQQHPCAVCGGFDEMPRHENKRCWGFTSGRYIHCTRSDYAGGLPSNESSETYAHLSSGRCNCGVEHAPGLAPPSTQKGATYRPRKREGVYPYQQADGEARYSAIRYKFTDGAGGKTFALELSDGHGGWRKGRGVMKGVERLLYRLPEMLRAPEDSFIFLAEGEKNVDGLRSHGLVATANSEGAKHFQPGLVPNFKGLRVVLLEDSDADGRTRSEMVSKMHYGVAEFIKILRFPGLPERCDILDWLAEHSVEELLELVERVPEYKPPPGKLLLPARTAKEVADYVTESPDWLWKGYVAPRVTTELTGQA